MTYSAYIATHLALRCYLIEPYPAIKAVLVLRSLLLRYCEYLGIVVEKVITFLIILGLK